MKSNSFETEPYSTFILGRNITLEDSKPLMLINKVKLSDIIITVKWNNKDYIMPLIFTAKFYGNNNVTETIPYPAVNNNIGDYYEFYNSQKVERYKTFDVHYIKFEYFGLHSGDSVSLNIASYVMEDDKERQMYADRQNDIINGV